MKLFKTTLLFGGLVAMAASLSAQSALVNVTVPFSFLAGSKVMPAGPYTIEQPGNGGVLLIRGTQSDASALVLAVNAGQTKADHCGVTFSRRGGAVVMSTVEVPGGYSYTVIPSDQKTVAAVRVALPRK